MTAPGPLSVVLAGGGTAGHVSPLLATAEALLRLDPATRVTVLGTAEGLEARLVPAAGLDLRVLPRVPLPRRPTVDLLRVPGRLAGAVAAARRVLTEVSADVVVGFGGYVATPAYLAARQARVPVVVHEQNALPGLANRVGARLTPWVATTFEGTPLRGAQRVGLPLRAAVAGLDRDALRGEARAALGLRPDLVTLLVTGGSLGAQRLNDVLPAVRADLAAAGVQVLHVSGRGKTVTVPDLGAGPGAGTVVPYVVEPYLDRMDLAYAACDAVVCRAGAGTVCELSALGLPAAYVPLPVGNGEQRRNAEPLVAAGGGLLVADADLTPAWVRTTLLPLLADPDRLAAMAGAARAHGVLDAADRLAGMVVRAATGGTP
ncbi:undecaprenyldiphospho-muramoylpentapeptide beta-N-acetylglucosaminyltransferase [Aquipuribacter hungaricus]|uniref:UDP-N-acetylglucosamine--N-acetylmuramyl-(pentapeptide) pyrophosphoryl-undecaprenol N-acetylglucosamine transferase n=1 Tax=Aquipuribacter hungaricus TaxID=545624 RepID=A0ABV7WKL6_9MICO